MDLRENTLEAYARAFALGAEGIECDARRTADDVLVSHHDAVIANFGPIVEHAFADIRSHHPQVPTLIEVLHACRGKRCNIEVKNTPPDPDFDPAQRIVALVAEVIASADAHDAVIVSSFNLASIDAFRGIDPRTPTGWLTPAVMSPIDALPVVVERGHAALHPNVLSLTDAIIPEVAARASAAGIALHAWTVNDAAAVATLARHGFAMAITDDVPMARAALAD